MKREIEFVKINPTQNMTVLVNAHDFMEDSPANRMDGYVRIAAQIMAYDGVHAEQVGFIERPAKREADAHLQMAGGEFCGNGCMALAAYIASERGLRPDDWTEIVLETSGADQLIRCLVKHKADGFDCELAMPVPAAIEQRTIRLEGSDMDLAVVRYREGIHIVIEAERFDETLRNRAQTLARLLGVATDLKLIGIMLYKPDTEEMAPLIYVPPLDSMVWERGCGSGTASVGAYLAWKRNGAVAAQVRQPGGVIRVKADGGSERLTGLRIESSVGIVARGKAYVEI